VPRKGEGRDTTIRDVALSKEEQGDERTHTRKKDANRWDEKDGSKKGSRDRALSCATLILV